MLGRLIAEDPEDHNYLMVKKLPKPTKRTKRMWPHGGKSMPLDQGSTSTCVAHGWSHFLLTSPFRNKLPMKPFDLYRRIVVIDEFPENDGEATARDDQLQYGSSVRAGAKALQSLGYLKEYSWAFSGAVARQWVLDASPVVLGTDWYSKMYTTDLKGFLHVDGRVNGGHCFLWLGVNLNEKRDDGKRGVDYFLNSWGVWGLNKAGVFKMRSEDTDALIAAQGEAATATELLRKN